MKKIMLKIGAFAPVLMIMLFAAVSYAAETGSLYDIPFDWLDENEREFNLESLKGTPVVVSLAYTKCKTACPLTMQRIKKISEKLTEKGKEAKFIIISLDSENDTSEALSKFKRTYKLPEDNWHLLRGSDQDVRKLAVLIKYSYQRQLQPIGPDAPSVEEEPIIHSNKIIALDTNGRIAAELEGLGSDIDPFAEEVAKLD